MKAQMDATLKNDVIDIKTDAYRDENMNLNLYSTRANKDVFDVVEAGDGTGENRDLAPPTLTSSYNDGTNKLPTNPIENKDDDKNQTKTSMGTSSSFWSFSGDCTAEIDHLTTLGRPNPKQTYPKKSKHGYGMHSLQRGSNSHREGLSPETMHGLSDTLSYYGTELTTAPSLVHSRADSTNTGPWAKSLKVGSVYERRRMASREIYPIFHWQETLDDNSVGIMSLDY